MTSRPSAAGVVVPPSPAITPADPTPVWPAILLDGDPLRDSAIRAAGGLLALREGR